MNAPRIPLSVPRDFSDPSSSTRLLLDCMTEGVSLSREDGTIVYTNPAEDRLFGYEPGELLGRHVSVQNAYPPDENERVVATVIDALKTQGSWQGEWLNRRKDGSVFTTRSRISALEVEGQRFWLCVQEDVTEEVAAAKELREERTLLKLATEAAGIGIWDQDVATRRMTYSSRARAIFGIPEADELTPERIYSAIHPDDRARVQANARAALDPQVRRREPYEYRVVHADGSVRWILGLGEAIFEESEGEPRAVRYLGTIQDITARHDLEEAERRAAQRLRIALDAGHMAVWDVDLVKDEVTGTPDLNRLLGFPEDEPLDVEAVRAGYYPGERERLGGEFQAALARGETSFEAELRYIRPDGGHRWLMLRCEVMFDADQKPVRAIGVLLDDTDRKRAANDLRVSEARLQLATTVADAGVWDLNLRTLHSLWSRDMYELFGIDPDTPPAATHVAWQHVIHPEDREKTRAWVERARHETGVLPLDYRILDPEGEVRWIRSRAIMVPGSDGKPERMVGIEFDVTREYQQAESLRSRAEALEGEVEEQRRELDRFFALSSDLFAVAGFDGYLKSINPAWSRLLGYPGKDLLSRPFAELIHPHDRGSAAEVIGRLRSGTAVQQFQDRLLCQDGRSVWISWAAVAEGDHFYAVGRDVTHEREREEILRQSQKMEALGQLTGGIAHDFNNLLQAVQGSFALILKRPEAVDRVRSLAEQGLQATRRGSSLSAQLLAFSRSQRLEVQPVSVGHALASMRDLLQRSLDPLVSIVLQPLETDLVAYVDPTQLEMAVLNLSLNARDAMPGGGTISIRADVRQIAADPELSPGDYVVVQVIDTGSGMTPEVARRAFEPFFTTKGPGKGTGLGLSQVYAMARQSGGTVRVDTRLGQGTTVCLFLRRADEPSRGDEAAPGAALNAGAEPVSSTILIIDDDENVRRWLVSAIEMLGYRAIEAADGASGLSALDEDPDLMLVDFAMPGMSGAEVVKATRTIRPELPIILATGYADTSAIEAVGQPDLVVLRKPFELDELDAVVRRMLINVAFL